MNILLLYPEFPDTFWSFKHALKFIRKRAALPPLGIITVASLLPSHWKSRLIDLNVRLLHTKDIEWADYVLISAMTIQQDSALDIIQRCHDCGKKIIAGGPLFTCEAEKFGMVDHLVLNEAELTLPMLFDDIDHDRPLRHVYQSSDFPDITHSPTPNWSLLDMKRYASMSIQYSRGCPFQCEFCNVVTLFGNRQRTKSSSQIISELDALFAAGWRGQVFFVDDNFIGNTRRLKDHLLPALIEWQKSKKGITFNTEASINLADDEELMSLMGKAGFDAVFIGIESPDEHSLNECHKNQNRNRDMIADIKRIQRFGLQVQGGFIVGFDNDKPSIFQSQVDFIQQSGIVTAMVGLLQAIPGSRLYNRMKSEKRLSGEASGDNVDGRTNIITTMSSETLYAGYQSLLAQIYSPREYYQRVKTFLSEYSLPDITPRIDFDRFLAFFRSAFHLGIVGKERFQYWHLLAWTLRYHHKLLPLAVTLAIYGHHFRKVYELHVQS